MLEGKRVMYYNTKGDRHPRGTLELNAGSRLKKIPTKEFAFHVVSDKQVNFSFGIAKIWQIILPERKSEAFSTSTLRHTLYPIITLPCPPVKEAFGSVSA